jgi:hypothetical protein
MSNRFLAVSCRPSSLVNSISSGGEKVDDCISLPYVEFETGKTVRPEEEKRKELARCKMMRFPGSYLVL